MIYIYLGNEITILNRYINELISKLKISNMIKYDYDIVSLETILNECCYIDLFNEKKIIIVSNFSFKKLKENEEKQFMKYIDSNNDNVIIFKCIDESLDERKTLIKKIHNNCKVEKLISLGYRELESYVTKLFKDENIVINRNQIIKILELCEYNTDFTLNEIDKLLLYKIDDKIVKDEDIEEVISKNPEKEIFNLLNSVSNKDISSSFNSLKVLLSANMDEIIIIDSLAKQFRTLYQVKILNGKMSNEEISKKLGINPYVIKLSLNLINNFKEIELLNILYDLSECDRSIKISGFDKRKVLENFLLGL